jgi:hypothetical protein
LASETRAAAVARMWSGMVGSIPTSRPRARSARAKQTLPNGYCGLPLQQSCPHPNACLTCDHFLTTPEFLPGHREQLARTERLIAHAEADGRRRVAEMNGPVRLNLIRIIDGLEALEPAAPDAA